MRDGTVHMLRGVDNGEGPDLFPQPTFRKEQLKNNVPHWGIWKT